MVTERARTLPTEPIGGEIAKSNPLNFIHKYRQRVRIALNLTSGLSAHALIWVRLSLPLEHKRGVVETLAYRAKTEVSKREDRRKELDHPRGALKYNGYPEWILRDINEENKNDSDKEKHQVKRWKHQ